MARNRNKIYKQGDRINIYLSRDLTPEFVEWVNMQSDLSNFFLYAAQQLYQQTGFVDVSEVMPRKINYELQTEAHSFIRKVEDEPNVNVQETSIRPNPNKDSEKTETSEEKTSWSNLKDIDDDPFA